MLGWHPPGHINELTSASRAPAFQQTGLRSSCTHYEKFRPSSFTSFETAALAEYYPISFRRLYD